MRQGSHTNISANRMTDAGGVNNSLLLHVCCGPCVALPLLALTGAPDCNAALTGAPECNAALPLLALTGAPDCNAALPLFALTGAPECNAALPLPALTGAGEGNPVKRFRDVTGLFYNPNIHPETEFYKRLDSAKKLFADSGSELIIREDYMRREWEEFESGAPLPGTQRQGAAYPPTEIKSPRCAMCYRVRLSYTAKYAADNGYGAFSTSLLISPYQDHALITEICREQARAYGTEFYYFDFRSYFRDGQKLAREMGLYRQKYCGCIFSQTL